VELNPVLKATSLRKAYGARVAVDALSFSVAGGEIVGLVGPNGAGKTTTISMILGVLAPDSGSIHIEGHHLAKARGAALSRTNFAAVYAPLPGNLTVEENLRIFGMLYETPDLTSRMNEVIAEFDLDKFRRTRCGVLSSGEQTRVSLAKAMLNNPALLLLDEPTASLDPSTARAIRARIQAFAARGKGGVLWTSHNMAEVEATCDRLLFLSRGRILLEGNPRTLAGLNGHASLEDLFVAVAREPLREDL
jgi:ABC-2 type transport system ATP-binding protein